MMVAIGALVLAVLYLYSENKKLKVPVAVPVVSTAAPKEFKKVRFAQPVAEEKSEEKSVPTELE